MLTFHIAALLIGIVAGLRAATAAAAVCWAAALGMLRLSATPLWMLREPVALWLSTGAVVFELISDKLPTTPGRKTPLQFGARLLMGGLAGAAIGTSAGAVLPGAALGLAGAAIGTYAGAAFRPRLAAALQRDLPAALIEDVVAIGGAALIVVSLP